SELTQREMDLAASIQAVTEDIVIKLAKDIQRTTRQRNLCLAGGVALNCVANGKLLREGRFDNIWIQPAAGDAGGALGAALAAFHLQGGGARVVQQGLDGMSGSYLGPVYDQAEIEKQLAGAGARFQSLAAEEVVDTTAAGQQRRHMTTEEEALFGIDKLNIARSAIPAVTHIDYSARVQTVHEETNPLYHALLQRFHALTGCPVLVNTSFNIRSEPIV